MDQPLFSGARATGVRGVLVGVWELSIELLVFEFQTIYHHDYLEISRLQEMLTIGVSQLSVTTGNGTRGDGACYTSSLVWNSSSLLVEVQGLSINNNGELELLSISSSQWGGNSTNSKSCKSEELGGDHI
jgi:hypothetical protein